MKSKARKPFADSAILGARLAATLGHERSPMIDIILPAKADKRRSFQRG